MNLPLHDFLGPLYDVELGSIMADLDDMPPNERTVRKERLSSALETIRKFISSFAKTVLEV